MRGRKARAEMGKPTGTDATQRINEGLAKKELESAQNALRKAKGVDEARVANAAIKAAQQKYDAVVRERVTQPKLFR